MTMYEHPEIGWAERTGYPSWNHPEEIYCQCCGDVIDEDVYEDETYDTLCEFCLKQRHRKEW